jgi:hypothetical protein
LESTCEYGIEPLGSISHGVTWLDTVFVHLQERDLLEVLGIDGRKILEWTLKKQVSIQGIGLIWLRIGIIGEPL